MKINEDKQRVIVIKRTMIMETAVDKQTTVDQFVDLVD